MEGTKYDNGKPKLSLIPQVALFEVAKVFTFGAKKYGKHNWRKGIEQTRLLDAAMRHILWYLMGEDEDPEWKCNHLAHAIAGLAMALEQHYFNKQADDRFRLNSEFIDELSNILYER